ncbi:hypothetical protein MRS76_14775 [Rhizobiaceae bacterium n13]|uniref:histidine kinase n=1 Tax=Ferirhizobium litorale TaxID=2927786 RepID=A0AAE3QGQ1_9HYPH|nr:histidine kinase dimerization/phosphoacceptor domain -containing protein [Fererhizobium litorale]MDI7863219.1 hypothetical protein [Fererhizobium litorale]MDI7923046.1 hypothetical protein [Fererhizobium litorale]
MKNDIGRTETTGANTPMAAIALAGILLAALLGLTSLLLWQSYDTEKESAQMRAEASAHVVAAHVQWMIEASNQALRRIDAALGEAPIRSSIDTIADITQAVGNLPRGFQYSVYDERGQLRLSSVHEAIGINVADRSYFAQLKGGENFVISQLLEERLSGETVFIVARSIRRDGRFHGAASIAIPTRSLDEFWQSLDLGPNSTITLVHTDGKLVARRPQVSQEIDLKGSELFQQLANSPQGHYESWNSAIDGLNRIVGYWKVDNWPLVAAVGIEQTVAFARFRQNLEAALFAGLPLVAMLLAALYWIGRLLRRDANRRQELEAALVRNNYLLREIHHRVKNNLQTVSSLVRLEPSSSATKADLLNRISAMVAVHEQIYSTDQFEEVEIAPYIERIVREIAAAYDKEIKLDLDLAPLIVDRDKALPLGMIVNEVVSNAFKYAFDGPKPGVLKVVAEPLPDDQIKVTIADNGPGIASDNKGMGSRLIEGFAAQLGGEYAFTRDNGTTFTLTMPRAS